MRRAAVAERHDQKDELDTDGRSPCGRLLVCHGNAVMAAGLKMALAARSWDVEAAPGASPESVAETARALRPHCALIDVHLHHHDRGGVALIEPLLEAGAQVVMLTAERRGVILAEGLEAGAAGWIGLDADLDEVDSTLRDVIAGRAIIGACRRAELLDLLRSERSAERRALSTFDQLTPREIQVLTALTDGFSADQIAQASFVSVATIRSQIRAVLCKLGVNSQLAAVAIASAHRELLPQAENLGPTRRQSDRRTRAGEQLPPAATA